MNAAPTPPIISLRDEPGLSNEVRKFAAQVTEFDGVSPFNEATMLGLENREALLKRADGQLVAVALLNRTAADTVEIELAVHPEQRRRGLGGCLTETLQRESQRGTTPKFWAHGNLPAAQALAASLGLTPVRTLFVLEIDLEATRTSATKPSAAIRTFDPARDADQWIALNAEIFKDHPEQGAITRSDLADRMAQPWFDSDNFFVIEEEGKLVGYNWLKVTPDEAEIYVLGTAPSHSGRGLGKALMNRGFERIRELGFQRAVLYVDGDNDRALGLYRALGFHEKFVDVTYQ